MRELLEKAHQEDDDVLFREEADDEEFKAPRELDFTDPLPRAHTGPEDQRDVYLEDFADTDDEVELDEEAEERALRREERRRVNGLLLVAGVAVLTSPRPKAKPRLTTPLPLQNPKSSRLTLRALLDRLRLPSPRD